MLKRILLSAVLFVSVQIGFGQNDTSGVCGTPEFDTVLLGQLPWFGYNDYLENFLDSIGYPSEQSRIANDNVKYRVPVKFWIYRRTNGTGGLTETEIRDYLDHLNKAFITDNRTWIGFYMKCNITYINDDDALEITLTEADAYATTRYEAGALNIHVVDRITNDAGPVNGYTSSHGNDACFLSRTSIILDPTIIAHEVGHYFGLAHTHQYNDKGKCRREAIDRNRTWPFFNFCFSRLQSNKICEATGDVLRDTPADHGLSDNYGTGCFYTPTVFEDLWGDSYTTPPAGSQSPDPNNLMCYNGTYQCRKLFTRLQIAVMLYSIERGRHNAWRSFHKDTRGRFDLYEVDNTSQMARTIIRGEFQEHNFHQEFTGNIYEPFSACDVDWVRFAAPCNGTFTIETSHLAGYTDDANTNITLFDANLNQLAQNDDISPSNLFSRIVWNFNVSQVYYIRVQNMSPQLTGYYNLAIDGRTISGADKFCTSTTYSVNTPAGTAVTWSVSPTGVVNPSPNGSSVTLTNTGSSNGTTIILTATYQDCNGVTRTVTKSIVVGLNTPSFVVTPLGSGYCQGQLFEAIGSSLDAPVTYNWEINGIADLYHGYKIRRTFPANTTTITLSVFKAGCGTSNEVSQTFICGSAKFTLSPNPTRSSLKIDIMGNSKIREVRIMDKMGKVKKDIKYQGNQKSVIVNVSNLSANIYTVLVFDGINWSGKILSIQD